MSQPPAWAGERVVDEATASRLIGTAFPDLASEPVSALAEGWDSTVFRVGDEWAFQFPRRSVVVPALRREAAVLPDLAPSLPLPISVPERVADDDAAEPWPFAGCRFIPGVELADSGLGIGDRVGLAADVGRFLRALHDIDPEPFRDRLVIDPNGRGTPARSVEHTRTTLDSLRSKQVVDIEWGVRALIEQLLLQAAALPEPDVQRVVHGDLHARHVIVDASARAVGVIDWVDVCLADPALDLSIAYSAFAGPAREALLDAYGRHLVDPVRSLRARALGFRLSLMLADYAASRRNQALLAESLQGMLRSLT